MRNGADALHEGRRHRASTRLCVSIIYRREVREVPSACMGGAYSRPANSPWLKHQAAVQVVTARPVTTWMARGQ